MKTHKHVLELPGRTVTLTVTERPDRIGVTLHCSQYGDLNDGEEIAHWILGIGEHIEKEYNGEPPPIQIDNYLREDSDAALLAQTGAWPGALAMLAIEEVRDR
jgi:hypothetical protein